MLQLNMISKPRFSSVTPPSTDGFNPPGGIVNLSHFGQKTGSFSFHNSLIIKHSGYWPEVENQPNLT